MSVESKKNIFTCFIHSVEGRNNDLIPFKLLTAEKNSHIIYKVQKIKQE